MAAAGSLTCHVAFRRTTLPSKDPNAAAFVGPQFARAKTWTLPQKSSCLNGEPCPFVWTRGRKGLTVGRKAWGRVGGSGPLEDAGEARILREEDIGEREADGEPGERQEDGNQREEGQQEGVGKEREVQHSFGEKLLEWLLHIRPGEKLWTVPWKGDTIFLVMILWFAAFWFVGSWGMPLAAHALSWSFTSSVRGMAFYTLLTDMAEMAVGLSVLYRCLMRFLPLPKGWFAIQWKGKWPLEVIVACFSFPLVKMLMVMNIMLLPVPVAFPLPTQVEQCLKEPLSMFFFVLVLSICAPIWEEVLFRGFLLPSLTRYLPIGGAIVVSSLIFALVHFQPQRLLSLAFLGMILGCVFVRSRNLLPSMLLHSLWNTYVIADYLLRAR